MKDDRAPGWWESLERQPVGRFAVATVLVGWTVLAVLALTGFWTLEVAISLAVALLTMVLGVLALYAAVSQARRPESEVLRPVAFAELEDYFRWLTPVAFFFGLVFAHYFWH